MTSQILRSVHFTKAQKSKCFHKKNIAFSSNKKNCSLHIKGYFVAKISFVAEVTFNDTPVKHALH